MICQSCNNCSICKIFAAVRDSLGVADIAVNSCTAYVPRSVGEKSMGMPLTTPDLMSRSEKIREALNAMSSPDECKDEPDSGVPAEPASEDSKGKCAICGEEDTELFTCSKCGKKICMNCVVIDSKERFDAEGKVLCSECW